MQHKFYIVIIDSLVCRYANVHMWICLDSPNPLLSQPKQRQEAETEKQWLVTNPVTDKRQTWRLSLEKKTQKTCLCFQCQCFIWQYKFFVFDDKGYFSMPKWPVTVLAPYVLGCCSETGLTPWKRTHPLCRFLGSTNRAILSFRWLYTNRRQSPEPIAWTIMCTFAGGIQVIGWELTSRMCSGKRTGTFRPQLYTLENKRMFFISWRSGNLHGPSEACTNRVCVYCVVLHMGA